MELASLLKVTFGLVLLVSQSLTQQALHRRQQNMGGVQKGMETGKGQVYQVCLLYFFIISYFYSFPPAHSPSPGESPNYTMPSCRTRKMNGAFLDFGGYSLCLVGILPRASVAANTLPCLLPPAKHGKHERVRIFHVLWVTCPLPYPPTLPLPSPTCQTRKTHCMGHVSHVWHTQNMKTVKFFMLCG